MSTRTGYLWGLGLGIIITKLISPTNLEAILVGMMLIFISILTWQIQDSQSPKQRNYKEVTNGRTNKRN